MAKILTVWDRFIGGISDYQHESPIPSAYYFGRSIDVRTEPHHIGVLPRTVKESGTIIEDLPKWGETYQNSLDTYFYGDEGKIYKRTSARSYSLLRTVNNSHGNGLVYSKEDDYLYYLSDKTIGRYGPLSGTPQFVDDYFGSQGGIPLNTNSLDLESGSSQYASRADTASLSITGDLAISAQIKPESLPAVGNSMVIFSKWDESGTTRSYKFDIYSISGYFGDGSDGALTISSNTTEAPIDSACTGTSGTTSLSATNASFAADQVILIHQSRGTGAGTWQRNTIISYTAGTITLESALNATYTSGTQARVLKQYTDVTVNSGIDYVCKAWTGTIGGIIAFIASGTTTVTGRIFASFQGFQGATADTGSGDAGEGSAGAIVEDQYTANGNGGGGGQIGISTTKEGAGGGGGGGGLAGETGHTFTSAQGGVGGSVVSTADLTTMVFGGGGGAGGADYYGRSGTNNHGGDSGAIVFITSSTITVNNSTGNILSLGDPGGNADSSNSFAGGGGGGAGGSILLKAQIATLNTNRIQATGGAAGNGTNQTGGTNNGGTGANGRIHLDYYTSYTGTTTPTLDAAQDNSLVTTATYQLRLSVSSDGDNSESLVKEFTPVTGVWQEIGVSWDASASTATFYLNAVSLGTRVGTFTAIHNNASTAQIGMSKNGASAAANFYDGLIDEVRIFNTERTTAQFLDGLIQQIAVNTAGLQAYYKLNDDANDATANANHLTASGSPVYSTDVPFPSPTTRLDIDQSATTSGQTYTLPIAISESSTNRLTFTPSKDPQKSIAVYIDTIGTGDWTLTVHDTNNNTVASKTVATASLNTGYYEFIFSTVWRPFTNFTNEYHFHLTSTVADGLVKTSGAGDLETATFKSYYQFLVTDIEWHPGIRFLNFLVFGNERYLAKYEAPLYEPNKIILDAGWRVRCFAYWLEYLAIGVMKGDTLNTFDVGRIYFWDGISDTYNFFIDVPEGGINAMLGSKNKLYIWAGYHADLLTYEGGSVTNKIKEIPLLNPKDYTEVYPQAVTMWMANPRYGLAGSSNSTDIQKGVYTWGSKNYQYPDSLTYDWPISTGTLTGNNLKIGMILPSSGELLIGWQDNVSYGVDYVNLANDPFPTANIQMMIEDLEKPYKEKEALLLVSNFDTLPTGCNVSLKYMNDEDDTDWHINPVDPTAGDRVARMNISSGRYHHINVACDITSSGSSSPLIKHITLVNDDLSSEETYG